jgi:hypothetical protein
VDLMNGRTQDSIEKGAHTNRRVDYDNMDFSLYDIPEDIVQSFEGVREITSAFRSMIFRSKMF